MNFSKKKYCIELTRSKIFPTPSQVRKTSCFASISTCSGRMSLHAMIHSETPSKSRNRFKAPSRLCNEILI